MFSIYFHWAKKAFNIAKKILLIIVVYFVVIGLFMHFFSKGKPQVTFDPVKTNREEIYKIVNDPTLNKTKEGKITLALYRSIPCLLIGEACTNNPIDGNKNFKKSLFGFMTNLIVFPYANPPASGIYWVYSGLQNANFIPKTYAAGVGGIGFNSLSAFIPVWDAFRKVAYLILVLVIITIGFMIMFRMKLNPQTVISVENAMPKIIITLLLITFSYAIVGFAVDLMYLITIVGVDLIGGALNLNVPSFQKDILTSNMFNYIFTRDNFVIYIKAMGGIYLMLPEVIRYFLLGLYIIISTFLTLRLLTSLSDWIAKLMGHATAEGSFFTLIGAKWDVGSTAAAIIGLAIALGLGIIITGFLFILFVIFTFLFLAFRIFFILLSSLIQIILYLIFAPLIILLEAVPGRSGFTSWLKNIIGNLLTFPTVIFLIIITNGINKIYLGNQPTFTPPFLSDINPNAIVPLIDAVMLLMIPDLVKVLKQAIIGKEAFGLPILPGILFGAGGQAISTATGGLSQLYYAQMGLQAIAGHKDEHGNRVGGVLSLIGGLNQKKPSG
jgi:hypothetical protein